MEYLINCDDHPVSLKLPSSAVDQAPLRLTIDGQEYTARWHRPTRRLFLADPQGMEQVIRLKDWSHQHKPGKAHSQLTFSAQIPFYVKRVVQVSKAYRERTFGGKGADKAAKELDSPITGTVIGVLKKVGDSIQSGEAVMIIEAMKMENKIIAEDGGKIKKIHFAQGQVVQAGDTLMELE